MPCQWRFACAASAFQLYVRGVSKDGACSMAIVPYMTFVFPDVFERLSFKSFSVAGKVLVAQPA